MDVSEAGNGVLRVAVSLESQITGEIGYKSSSKVPHDEEDVACWIDGYGGQKVRVHFTPKRVGWYRIDMDFNHVDLPRTVTAHFHPSDYRYGDRAQSGYDTIALLKEYLCCWGTTHQIKNVEKIEKKPLTFVPYSS